MLPTCHEPWHFLWSGDGSVTWFRWLTPFAQHRYHYRIGSAPFDDWSSRIYGFGDDDRPLTCAGCENVIAGPPRDPPHLSELERLGRPSTRSDTVWIVRQAKHNKTEDEAGTPS